MAKKLSLLITFKQEEKWLYDEIQRHSSKGGWVKDVLSKHVREMQELKENQSASNKGKVIDELF